MWVDNNGDVLHHDKSVRNKNHDENEDVDNSADTTALPTPDSDPMGSDGSTLLTQAVTMVANANSTGPKRFHNPLRSSCIAMAIRSAPPKKKT